MLDVNMPYYWREGRTVFTFCFVPSGMLMRHFLLRRQTNGSPPSWVVANVTMGAASWLFVVALPLAIAADQFVNFYILDRITTVRADPYSWISVLVLSAVVAAAAETAALRIFFRRKLSQTMVGSLFVAELCCVAVAAYASIKYVLAHPPIP
ncbi:MAG: hypothetical protein ABSB35_42945 [Bryobacteraceae bacterium]|jgi:hypothetical protein